MADSSTTQNGLKRKRACDYCKARRVICHPDPDGCPRCIEKGIQCTTTILPRRPRTKRARVHSPEPADNPEPEEESPSGGTSSSLALYKPSSFGGCNSHQTISHPLASTFDTIPGSLLQDALDVLSRMMPGGSLLFPVRRYRKVMQNCDWDVRLLAPQERVLTCCFLAFASLVSVDPFYVGHDAAGNRFPDTHLCWDKVSQKWMDEANVREAGRRRKPVSVRLYGEAVRQAHQDGISSQASRENAASCFMLNLLDVVYDSQSTMPWASAYIWQAQTLAELTTRDALSNGRSTLDSDVERVQWHGSLLAISAYSVSVGKSLPFSPHDEVLMTGPAPKGIEEVLAQVNELPANQGVLQAIHSFGTRCVRLTRDAIENIVGVTALQSPLDELEVMRHVTAAEHFYTTVLRFSRFIRSAGTTPSLQLCVFSSTSSFACLAVALYRTIRRRVCENAKRVSGSPSRLTEWCKRIRTLAARSVITAISDMRGVIAAHYLGMFQAGGFEAWAEVFLPIEKDEPLDESDVTTEERAHALASLREMIEFSVFTGVERTHIVTDITAELDKIRVGSSRASNCSSSSSDSDTSPGSSLHTTTDGLASGFDGVATASSSTAPCEPSIFTQQGKGEPDPLEWWNYPTSEENWSDMINWMEGTDIGVGDMWMGHAAT
ncbi:uncharacterized protein SCHCODRAFT_02635225 [Schizophyllum commune H4-8]|nr:uncharacterized protein SCHCODRAFT_02635225 [Schizophyllum commune H4-8]KAI5889654.1 hypothetical protein SCHCODRAFT_02635225 [Schizophyllum commune H4-8]